MRQSVWKLTGGGLPYGASDFSISVASRDKMSEVVCNERTNCLRKQAVKRKNAGS